MYAEEGVKTLHARLHRRRPKNTPLVLSESPYMRFFGQPDELESICNVGLMGSSVPSVSCVGSVVVTHTLAHEHAHTPVVRTYV